MKNNRYKFRVIIIISTFFLLNFINISFFFNFKDKIPLKNNINILNIFDEIEIPNDIYNIYSPYEKLPKLIKNDVNNPNLTRIGYPLILRMDEQPEIFSVLQGLNESHIRILFKNISNFWVEIPFQLDEKGWPLLWQHNVSNPTTEHCPILNNTHTYVSKNGSNNYEPTDPYGRDNGTQIPYAIDYDDEICFYIENGKRVEPQNWWNSSHFPNRIEINIIDPIDSGQSFMYIYFNNQTPKEIPVYQSYVNWNPENLTVTTQVYQKRFKNDDPDIMDVLRIITSGSDGLNFIDEMSKSFANVHLRIEAIFGPYIDDFDMNCHGTWGSYYDESGTGIDNPNEEAVQLGKPNPNDLNTWTGWDTQGDRFAVKNGPIRVILQKQTYAKYYVVLSTSGPSTVFHKYIHPLHVFYNNMEQYNEPELFIHVVPAIGTLYFDDIGIWIETVRFNSTIRDDFDAVLGGNPGNYPGYNNSEDANPYYSVGNEKYLNFDGNDTNDDLLNGGDPTTNPPTAPPAGNVGLADYIMVTSANHGGMWMYIPRKELVTAFEPYNMSQEYMYYQDITPYTEIGGSFCNIDRDDTIHIPSYEMRIVYGIFDNISDIEIAKLEYRRHKTEEFNLNISITNITKFPGPIFEYIIPNSVQCKNGSVIEVMIKMDSFGYNVTVDWSKIDSNGGTEEVAVDAGNGLYISYHTISAMNTRIDGVYMLIITAENVTSMESSTDNTTFLELDNKPPNPAQPDALPLKTTSTSICINWTANPGDDNPIIGNGTGSGINYYLVWRGLPFGGPYLTLRANITETSFIDSVTIGSYGWIVQTVDKVGHSTNSTEVWTNVSSIPQLGNLTEYIDPLEFGQEACIRIDAYDNETSVDTVIIRIINTNYTMNPIGGNTYEYNWTPVAIGAIEYTIFVNDTIDNNWNTLNNSIIIQDTTLPWLAGLSESADPIELGQQETIQITVTDLSGINQVLIEIAGVNNSMTNIGGDTYQYQWTPGATGLIAYTIYAEDDNNNWNVLSDSIMVQDTTYPTWSNLLESADPLKYGNNEEIWINATDLAGINQVLLEFENVNYTMVNIIGDIYYNNSWKPSNTGIFNYTIYIEDNNNLWNSTFGQITVYKKTKQTQWIYPIESQNKFSWNLFMTFLTVIIGSVIASSVILFVRWHKNKTINKSKKNQDNIR